MNTKIISGTRKSVIADTFYRMVQVTHSQKWLFEMVKKIQNQKSPWDSMYTATLEGLIKQLGATKVNIYIFNKKSRLLKLVLCAGKVKNTELEEKKNRIFKVMSNGGDSSIITYDRDNPANSYFTKARRIPGNEYKWLKNAIQTAVPTHKVYTNTKTKDEMPFILIPFNIDARKVLIVKVRHADLKKMDENALQEFNLISDSLISQVRNNLLTSLIDLNMQEFPYTEAKRIPKRGTSVSLLGVNDEVVLEKINQLKGLTDSFHIDVLDGHYVPDCKVFDMHGETIQKDFFPYVSAQLIKRIRESYDGLLDAHFMAVDSKQYIIEYAEAGVDIITISYSDDLSTLRQNINLIKNLGRLAGVAIKPETTFEDIKELLHEIDLVLVMTVPPGKGGQSFDFKMLDKISQLREYIEKNNLNVSIEVDGGINTLTGRHALKAGANLLVSGTAIVNSPDPKDTIKHILDTK